MPLKGDVVSLLNEFAVESAPRKQRSKVDVFIESLPSEDQDEFRDWLRAPVNKRAMFRVLVRRGLPVAESTFRNWVSSQCR